MTEENIRPEGSGVESPAFYAASGLHFGCRRCSGCCRFSPGFVFLSYEDVSDLLRATGLSLDALSTMYLRVVSINGFYRLSLREKSNNDCIFWEEEGCLIYEYRPLQCRSYPFWFSILASRRNWEEQKAYCPGIDHGRWHSAEEIDSWLRRCLTERLIEIDSDATGLIESVRSRLYENGGASQWSEGEAFRREEKEQMT